MQSYEEEIQDISNRQKQNRSPLSLSPKSHSAKHLRRIHSQGQPLANHEIGFSVTIPPAEDRSFDSKSTDQGFKAHKLSPSQNNVRTPIEFSSSELSDNLL